MGKRTGTDRGVSGTDRVRAGRYGDMDARVHGCRHTNTHTHTKMATCVSGDIHACIHTDAKEVVSVAPPVGIVAVCVVLCVCVCWFHSFVFLFSVHIFLCVCVHS